MHTTNDITRRFLEFFEDRGHRPVTGTGLIPPGPDDPVLFTTSGMHPLVPYLGGRPHPHGRRLMSLQRCLRTTDLDEVGDHTHLTVFGMLGSWSLGDYPGTQSQQWGLELLLDGYGISLDRIHVTVFEGDDRCGPDSVSEQRWLELGVPREQISRLPENWWGPNGPDGLCGPDTEMFVWTGPGRPVHDITRPEWVEVWNHVLMRYQLTGTGLRELTRPCVDTGMGLERLSMILQGKHSVYDTDSFQPWVDWVHGRGLDREPMRICCDHLRSSTVMIGDGVRPSNTGRGYVLRRVIRRTLRTLWEHDPQLTVSDLPDPLIGSTGELFGMPVDCDQVRGTLSEEELRFRRLLDRGRREIGKLRHRGPVGEPEIRWLYETHGIPPELTVSLLP